ncbi:pyrroline-5-carboxylate reductase [Corynebacterium bovis]|uniref:pyrroline-5-carboxylate reductase n=1 Tax=Corynebacterium bovis TaxID=36808 RepID=UPI000F655299|nr:pyrroline-5-carboxylate reductase [Corynebacterium bovis]RRO82123.1 pyrroline-5-carboxylate reductase [Corynebacterium bovis]RRO91570.1 pyrroline-5-carboxylate reductase [Corynebacterium bovis]
MTRIAIIGGGNIGEALLSGLINADNGMSAKDITVVDPSQGRIDTLRERYGVTVSTEGSEAADDADYIVVAVKPHITLPVLEGIADTVEGNDNDTVVVSVAAGVTIAAMEGVLPVGTPVVRVMPNTPMLVGKGVCAVAGGRFSDEEQVEAVRSLLEAVGTAVTVAEKDIDAVTAVSGSGPAYLFLVAEAMVDAGVNLGLPRDLATTLAAGTIEGAAAMITAGEDDPSTLRAKVTSPGGTTSAGVRALEENGLRSAFFRALQAAHDRSVELGRPADRDGDDS